MSLPRLHPAQLAMRQQAKRFNVSANGVRFGKTKLGIRLGSDAGLAGWPVAWFSPTYKMLEEIWTEYKARLMPAVAHKDEQQKRLELVTGGVIDFWSLDAPDTIRGRKYKIALIDEAAIVPKLQYAWENVILTRLTDYKGSAWFFSTPKGMNYFRQLFERGRNNDPDWKSWQIPTSANPYITAGAIEAARRNMTERAFRQEYLAEFLPDGAGVFRNVRLLSIAQPEPPVAERQYIIGRDWGRSNDLSVSSVWDVPRRREVFLETEHDVPFATQILRLKALSERYNDAVVVAERNSIGDPLIEQAQDADISIVPFDTTNATKAHAVDELVLAMERQVVTLQADEAGIMEMESFESSRTQTGLVKYSAPDGLHDDIVMARILAYSGLESGNAYSEPVYADDYRFSQSEF